MKVYISKVRRYIFMAISTTLLATLLLLGPSPAVYAQDGVSNGSIFEAEGASVAGPNIKSGRGSSGDQFVDYVNPADDYVEWSVHMDISTSRELVFRYANGSRGTRALQLSVNGAVVGVMDFTPTGSWNSWETQGTVATLASGNNTIRLTAVGQSGPNIDYLALVDAGAFAPPNVIVILFDDMGWSDLGAYGSEIQTPNLDSLAYGGIRYTHFYNAAKCFPTRASLLTGVYAQQNGLANSPSSYLHNAVTIGEVMRNAGYTTLMSGKHHGLDNPYDRGFDHSYGLLDGAANYFNPGTQRVGEAAPARKLASRTWMDDGLTFKTNNPAYQHYFPADFYSTDAFTDKAIEYLNAYQNDNKPFLLYLAYTAPHDPLHAFDEDIAKYEGVYDSGFATIRQARYDKIVSLGLIDPNTYPLSEPTHRDWNALTQTQKEDQIRRMQVYAAMIDRLDQNIGQLLDTLDAVGERENTMIIVASDNGASAENVSRGDTNAPIGAMERWSSVQSDWANVSNTPFQKFKNYSHEGGIVSPLIVYWPDGVSTPGRIDSRPIHLVDVMATMLDTADADYPRFYNGEHITPFEGESFLPSVMYGSQPPRDEPLFWERGNGQAVRDGDWKLVRYGTSSAWQLYDLSVDATETNNLATVDPARVVMMSDMWRAWYESASQLAPVSIDDASSLSAGGSVSIDVLANDYDADGTLDPDSVSIVQSASAGALTVNRATGAIQYTHTGTEPIADTFTYQVQDTDGAHSHEAVVTLLVAHPTLPLAVPDVANVIFGGNTIIDVYANDIDTDGNIDASTVLLVEQPQYGQAEIVTAGIRYTHAGSNYLIDSLKYIVSDNDGNISNVATAQINPTGLSQQMERLEAEDATLSGVLVKSGRGSSGDQFVDVVNQNGDYIEWTTSGASAGATQLDFSYGLGASRSRPMQISVNGSAVGTVNFTSTGGWNNWQTASFTTPLQNGTNTIRLTANGSSGPNFDFLTVGGLANAANYGAEISVADTSKVEGTVEDDLQNTTIEENLDGQIFIPLILPLSR